MSRSWLPAFLRTPTRTPIRSQRAALRCLPLEDRLAPAAFTPGNLVVYRVGDGVLTYGSAGTATPGNVTGATGAAVFLDEYTTQGTFVQSITVPSITSGSQIRLVNSLNSTSEAQISLSGDGQYVTFGGYDAAPSIAASVVSSTTNPRVIGRVKFDGTLDTSTTIAAYSAGNIRDVVTNDGNQFWTSGSNGGIRYAGTFGAANPTPPQVNSTANMRTVEIIGGRLYFGTGSGTIGISTSTTPLPTVSGGTDSAVATAPAASPYAFSYFDMDNSSSINAGDRLYVADDGGAKSVIRYTFGGSDWGTGTSIATSQSNLRSVTGKISGTDVVLYATVSTASVGATTSFSTSVLTFTDDGTAGNGATWSPLANPVTFSSAAITASPVIQFRGITFVPTQPAGVTTTTAVTTVNPLTVNLGSNVTLSASVTANTGGATPTGTVQFRNGSTIFGTVSVTGTGASGTATLNTTAIPAGTYSNITALFTPLDSNFVTSTSVAFGSTLTVNAFSTATTLTSNQTNPNVGTGITFTATVGSPGNPVPTGAVDFYANGLKLSTVAVNGSGVATFTIGTNAIQVVTNDMLTPGINDIEARFTGTGLFLNSSNEIPQLVKANSFGFNSVLLLRANDGYNTPSVNGNRTYIDEYLPGTTNQTDPVQSILLPTVASGLNKPVLTSGQQSTDTQIVLSPDGKYAYFTAYNALPTNTLPLHTSAATAVPRVIGRLTLSNGTIETSMALTDVASAGVFRGLAVTATGEIYASGSVGGLRYIPGGYNAATTTSTDLGNTAVPFANLTISGTTPQLYTATPSNAGGTNPKAALIGGPGLPTTGTPTVVTILQPGDLLSGVTPKNPESLFFADLSTTVSYAGGIDTMYVSEVGTTSLFSGGTVTKWTWKEPGGTGTGFQWVLSDTIAANTGGQSNVDNNFTYLSGRQSGITVDLVTSNGGGGNTASGGALWTISDTAGYDAVFSNNSPNLLTSVSNTSGKSFRSAIQLPAVATAPAVTGFVVNGGDRQRSRIVSVEVAFDTDVNTNLAAYQALGAVTFTRTALPTRVTTAQVGDIIRSGETTSGVGIVNVTLGSANNKLLFTFDNTIAGLPGTSETKFVEYTSLTDGYWKFTVLGGTGSVTGDVQLRRLFGDKPADLPAPAYDPVIPGTINGADLDAFGQVFSSNSVAFDFDNNGTINGADLDAFGNRFSNSL